MVCYMKNISNKQLAAEMKIDNFNEAHIRTLKSYPKENSTELRMANQMDVQLRMCVVLCQLI